MGFCPVSNRFFARFFCLIFFCPSVAYGVRLFCLVSPKLAAVDSFFGVIEGTR